MSSSYIIWLVTEGVVNYTNNIIAVFNFFHSFGNIFFQINLI